MGNSGSVDDAYLCCTSRRFGEMPWICNCAVCEQKFGSRRRSTNNWNNYKHDEWIGIKLQWRLIYGFLQLKLRNDARINEHRRVLLNGISCSIDDAQLPSRTISTSEQTRKFFSDWSRRNVFNEKSQNRLNVAENVNHLKSNQNLIVGLMNGRSIKSKVSALSRCWITWPTPKVLNYWFRLPA